MTWIYLSHVLRETTPLYGGQGTIRIERPRSIAGGNSSNNSELSFPAHAGTHVDAPRHFDSQGMTLDQYPPDYWLARRPALLDVPSQPAEILDFRRIGALLETVPKDCDLLLLRTGAEAWRHREPETYAKQGACIAADVAHWLRNNLSLKFLGIDFISVSSFAHRAIGREAHRVFLRSHESGSAPILLVEDMALSRLDEAPLEACIVPLLFSDADGAPVSVLARRR